MSLADTKKGMHRKFSKYLMKNHSVRLPENEKQLTQFDNFLDIHKHEIAGVFIEPMIQCAGGMKFHSSDTLKAIHKLVKKHNLIFIADECATGFYRTGKYFACNHANIIPDMMIVGKALTGGYLTLAATIVKDEIYNQFLSDDLQSALMHGPTFMGNPLACAAANASLELFESNDYENKVQKIAEIMSRELEKCRELKIVTDVRILGAIGVVEIKDLQWKEVFKLREDFVKSGIWIRPFSNVIYIMPPFTIEEEDLVKITDAIFKLCSEYL
jgi:adenosylmethionine-8-amino-7-oxononanoate aminotransferase